MPEVRVCNQCESPQPIEDYYPRNGICKPCIRSNVAAYRRRKPLTPEQSSLKARKYHLKKKYGLTVEEYDQMFEDQGGVCAICGTEPYGRFLLSVDHCHSTGEIRGLLCHPCNGGLGCFKDNIALMNDAIEYLENAK